MLNGVAGEYVVVLPADTPRDAIEGVARSLASTYSATLETIWANSLRGFLCTMPDTAAEAMGNDPRVDYVEQNVKGTYGTPISGTQWASWNGQYLWFLDRLDELSWANRDSLYNMCPEGRSVMAYVIDFGVWRDHSEFETPTRVVANIDFSDDRSDHNVQFGPDTTNGCHGVFGSLHGTAVASSLAARTLGRLCHK